MIDRLKSVPLREIWKHEAYDFTTWLFENCDVLNEQLGLSISPIEKEKSVGPFNVDILAEDVTGRTVIIENQLNRTDHDHLGKVLTYMTNLDAKVALWISTDPRPEHVTVINYLNEVVPNDTHFYLIHLSAFRIGESDAAPHFTIEAGPSEERKAGGDVKKEMAERDKIRYRFFEQLLAKVNEVSHVFNNVSPVGYQSWVSAGAGKSGLMWTLVAMKKISRVEFFLCHSDYDVNKSRFNLLYEHKKDIEQNFGESLDWDFNPARKQQYIKTVSPVGNLDNEDKWDIIQNDMTDRFVRLEKVIRNYIKQL